MAIQLNITNSQFGVPFEGAYFRIVTTAVSRTRELNNRFSVLIDVVGYATQPHDEDTRDVDFRRYECPLNEVEGQQANAFLDKCYLWVMSQPDMAGSIAV